MNTAPAICTEPPAAAAGAGSRPRKSFWAMTRGCELCRSAIDPASRPARVSAMLICIVAMSLADLYMTLAHLFHFGMIEANPVARRVIEQGSAAELIIWKLASVLLAVAIFFIARKRRSAEIGTLICFLMLAWLTAHWLNYNEAVSELTAEMNTLATVREGGWVTLTPMGR